VSACDDESTLTPFTPANWKLVTNTRLPMATICTVILLILQLTLFPFYSF
jgi:hypothetical protein